VAASQEQHQLAVEQQDLRRSVLAILKGLTGEERKYLISHNFERPGGSSEQAAGPQSNCGSLDSWDHVSLKSLDFEDAVEDAMAQSISSLNSQLSMLSASGDKCFLAGTLLQDTDGNWVPVCGLQTSSLVRSTWDRDPVEVTYIKKWEEETRDLVELRAVDASLEVTGDHRVMKYVGGNLEAHPARSARPGDDIALSSSGKATLVGVAFSRRKVHVVQIGFFPDLPVGALPPIPPATDSILTKGSRPRRRRGHKAMAVHDTDDECR
jgi:hypothetical protein